MTPTAIPEVNALLADLLARMNEVLGARLLGVYLYGSLVWGDFDLAISDLDMVAVLESDVTPNLLAALEEMHARFAQDHPAWQDRIEVQYAPRQGLKSFRTRPFQMANISPGEPIHIIEAGMEWLTNWYSARNQSITLAGAPPSTYIDPISDAEFLDTIRAHAQHWQQWVETSRDLAPYQSYAILTLCRALYTLTFGEQVSKQRAAQWAIETLPEEASLIRAALHTRAHARDTHFDAGSTYPETVRFVHKVIALIERPRGRADSLA